MKLNDRQIKLINYPSKGRETYSDGNSLYLRVTSKYKIWSYQYLKGLFIANIGNMIPLLGVSNLYWTK